MIAKAKMTGITKLRPNLDNGWRSPFLDFPIKVLNFLNQFLSQGLLIQHLIHFSFSFSIKLMCDYCGDESPFLYVSHND